MRSLMDTVCCIDYIPVLYTRTNILYINKDVNMENRKNAAFAGIPLPLTAVKRESPALRLR